MTALELEAKKRLSGYLVKAQKQIEAVVPKHMTPDRMLRLIVNSINTTPGLAECSVPSVINCVLTAAGLGLEIRPRSAYLVPFRKGGKPECTLLIDYRGKIGLAHNSGKVADIKAQVVYAADTFEYEEGSQAKLIHRPLLYKTVDGLMVPVPMSDRGQAVLAWAGAWLVNGRTHFEVMSIEAVNKIRDRSKAYQYAVEHNRTDTPWISDEEQQERKTLIHRVCNYIPLSPELLAVQDIEDRADAGISLDNIIDVEAEDDDRPIIDSSSGAAEEAGQRKIAAAKGEPIPADTPPDLLAVYERMDTVKGSQEVLTEILRDCKELVGPGGEAEFLRVCTEKQVPGRLTTEALPRAREAVKQLHRWLKAMAELKKGDS